MTVPTTELQRARSWLEQSIAAGQDPKMAFNQKPEEGRRRLYLILDEWDVIHSLEPTPLPKELYDSAFEVCKELGRISYICIGDMPWHDDMLPGDCTSEAVGARLKTAREAMEMDLASFYQPLCATARTAKSWEAGKPKRWQLYRLRRLQDEHHIPLLWMGFGNCDDVHAPDVEEPRTEGRAG